MCKIKPLKRYNKNEVLNILQLIIRIYFAYNALSAHRLWYDDYILIDCLSKNRIIGFGLSG